VRTNDILQMLAVIKNIFCEVVQAAYRRLLVAIVFLLNAMAASPALHELIHKDAEGPTIPAPPPCLRTGTLNRRLAMSRWFCRRLLLKPLPILKFSFSVRPLKIFHLVALLPQLFLPSYRPVSFG